MSKDVTQDLSIKVDPMLEDLKLIDIATTEETVSLNSKDPLGMKFDSEKPDYSLIPLKSLKDVVDVLTYGSLKYSRDNWRYVEGRHDRYWAAAMRHMISWKDGDILDDETGKNHLSHAVCCLMFLLEEDLENKKG